MITIYDSLGAPITDIDTSHAGVTFAADLSGSNFGTFQVTFASANAVTIPARSYVDPNDSDDPTDWYYLIDAVAPIDSASGYSYTLTFEHFSKLFQQIEFYYEDATETRQYSWTLSAKLSTAAGLIIAAIQREFPSFGVTLGGSMPDTALTDLSFDGLNVYEAMTYVASTFKTELWFFGAEMHFEEALFGESLPHELTHLVNIEDAITCEYDAIRPQYVRALGGLTNMPVTAEGAIAYQGRLPMPAGKEVIEIEGVNTGVTLNLKLDDYFPSMGGEITEVEYNDEDDNPIYYIKTDLEYTLKSVELTDGSTTAVYFTSGMLAGREFDVNDYGDDQIEIFRTEDKGIFIPRPYLAPAVGDTFLLKNVTVNDTEIAEAQEELEAYVDDYVETLRTKSPKIGATTDSEYYSNNPHTFRLGESVKVTHPSIIGGSTQSRIVGISLDWAEQSKVLLTIQDDVDTGRISTLESDLQNLTANVNSTTTNSNVTYDTRYVRKDKDDTVAGNITFEKNIKVEETLKTNDIKSDNFDESIRAGFGIFEDENGRGIGVFNEIRAEQLSVDIYTYNKIQAIGGTIVVSKAWAEVSRISVDQDGAYTFYYSPKDKLQLWRVGHQPRMASGGRYFWGVVTDISDENELLDEHYFKCSPLAANIIGDPADVQSGDTFVLYGSRGSDESAKNVTVISSGSSGNPYPTIAQYFGLDSFDLSNVESKRSANISYDTTIGVPGARIKWFTDEKEIYILGDRVFFARDEESTPTAMVQEMGAYIEGETYFKNQRVTLPQGTLYLCVAENGTDSTPSKTDTDNWLLQSTDYDNDIDELRDSENKEKIFKLSTTNVKPPKPDNDPDTDNYIPDGWTDDFGGVSAEVPYCFRCDRAKSQGVWSDWTEPALFTSFGLTGADGEDAISTATYSTNGNIFNNGNIDTVLSAHVFKGGTEVTDQILASSFTWTRVSDDTAGDEAWNTLKGQGKKSIAITVADVLKKAVFNWEVDSDVDL